jgi:hypothetical protein
MTEFMELYSEGGMVAVVGAMFMFLVYSMNARSSEQAKTLEDLKIENEGQSKQIYEILKETEEAKQIIIRLIDRFNKSDDTSLRHREDVVRELGDLQEKISYLSGRVNGSKSG